MSCNHIKTFQSRNPYKTRDRPDKSILVISGTRKPELFLKPDVAFPELVKCLYIGLCDSYNSLGKNDSFSEEERDEELYYDFAVKYYTRDLCKDIVHFHNLEHLTANGLQLTNELWCQFVNNSKHLKEIYLSNNEYDCDYFDFDEEILEKVFKIPTLEKVYISQLDLPFFPKGPSNIQDLHITLLILYEEYANKTDVISSYSQNMCTHTNLKKLCIERFEWFFESPEPLLNVAKNCVNLEDVEIGRRDGSGRGRDYIVISTDVVKALLILPKLKKLTLLDILNKKLVENEKLVFESIEHLEIRCEEVLDIYQNNEVLHERTLDDETIISLTKQCPNMKSCIVNNQELLPNEDKF